MTLHGDESGWTGLPFARPSSLHQAVPWASHRPRTEKRLLWSRDRRAEHQRRHLHHPHPNSYSDVRPFLAYHPGLTGVSDVVEVAGG